MVKQFVKLFAIQYGLMFCLYMRSLYEAPLYSPSSISIRQLDLMSINHGMSYSVIDGLVIIITALHHLCWPPAIMFYRCSFDLLFSPPNLRGRLADLHRRRYDFGSQVRPGVHPVSTITPERVEGF